MSTFDITTELDTLKIEEIEKIDLLDDKPGDDVINSVIIIDVDPKTTYSNETIEIQKIEDLNIDKASNDNKIDIIETNSIKNDISNDSNNDKDNKVNFDLSENSNEDESDAHLPRVRVELDRLNYANESINNLELELEESKREYLETLREAETDLSQNEKKIGNHVLKSVPYYEERMLLNSLKQKYLNAKFQFETAQELYVAAKNLQMYAEENLENSTINDAANLEDNKKSIDSMVLVKMLKMAKIKVSETEFSKQSWDVEQIEHFKVYDSLLKKVEKIEKALKTSIVKSLKYFEIKAKYNKELKFFSLKIEGLKGCLKEAKTTYQQSLTNLEEISTEVHKQRSFNINSNDISNNSLISTSLSSSTSTLSSNSVNNINSTSSPDLTNISEQNNGEIRISTKKLVKSNSLTTLTVTKSNPDKVRIDISEEEQDYDKYFTGNLIKNELEHNKNLNKTVSIRYSQKLNKNAICLLSDEDIENLRLDKKLKKFENELFGNSKKGKMMQRFISKDDSTYMQKSSHEVTSNNGKMEEATEIISNTPNRPQFRVPFSSRN